MAGIGFQLRRLQRTDTISAIVASAGHAAMIAAGPWLFTILALAIITLAGEPVAGLEALADFRAVVIYAFALSLIFSAPVTIVTTRLIGDALWQKAPQRVRSLAVGAMIVVLGPVTVAVLACWSQFRLSVPFGVVLSSATLVVSEIWVAIAFCGAVRDYRGVTLSFAIGLATATAACIALAILGFGAPGLAVGFIAGLVVTLFGLIGRVFATFPHKVRDPRDGIRAIIASLAGYWPIGIGAFLGAFGVWIDKFVFWGSPLGETVDSGLRHAPLYDSSMFIASLLLIPGLASFIKNLETGFFERYQQYFASISSHGTLTQIEDARLRMARYTMESLALTTVGLAGMAGILLLAAPVLIDALGLQFRQIAILRYGALGAVFQFIFIAASSMLLFFDRRRHYLGLQAFYLVASAVGAWISIQLGEDFVGVGYFVVNLMAAMIAYVTAERTFGSLNYLTFIGNNPSIQDGLKRLKVANR